jgi:DNA-binding NtrC family response regulator
LPETSGGRKAMEKFKVLLVDDEEEFVKALSERLQMRDMGSDMAFDGEQALQIVKDQEPDVMVLDLKMPGIDGMEVLRQVRKAYPRVQVIILTGHGTDKDAEEAERLGAFAYLQKPVNLDQLVQTMRKAYKSKMEDAMVAATFAEAGDFRTAREIMDEDKKKKK